MLLEEHAERFAGEGLYDALHFAVAQLGLGLAFELGVRDLYGHDHGKTFAHVVAGDGIIVLFRKRVFLYVIVDHAGQGRAEAGHVRAAFGGLDVVHEGEHRLGVVGVILDGQVQHRVAFRLGDEDRLVVDDLLVGVEELHELLDAALEEESVLLVVALVDDGDAAAGVQEGQLAQAVGHGVERKYALAEDLGIGLEVDHGAVVLGGPYGLDVGLGLAALVLLPPDLAVAVYQDFHPLGQRVHYGNAHAVQAA